MVHVIAPEGGGQCSHLAPFSLAVAWPARCAAITPAGNVREGERDTDRETEGGGRLKSNSQGHLESSAGGNMFLFKSGSHCTAGAWRKMCAHACMYKPEEEVFRFFTQVTVAKEKI